MATSNRLLFMIALVLGLAGPALAAEVGPQKSSASGVTISVSPNLNRTDLWEFKILLDTHTADLNDDLVKTSVLVDPAGTRITPTSWNGAAPGGHHREGVLQFPAITPRPSLVELQIQRPGEANPRIFRWQLR